MWNVSILPSEGLRIAALRSAVSLYTPTESVPWWAADKLPDAVLTTAETFLTWLRQGGYPSAVHILAGPPQDESDDSIPSSKGQADMAAMNTGQKIHLAADPEDAAGYDVDVPVVFSVADESVVSLVSIDDEPKAVWAVSGAPGSTVVTVTVTNLAGDALTGTTSIDVVPADVAVVNIVAGEPEPE